MPSLQAAHDKHLTRSPDQVREEFRRQGVTFATWAKENNFSASAVYQVLSGQRKCLRGQSFEIARRLGIR